MTIDELAAVVADACLAEGVPYMFTGALATGLYGSPRSTADVDVVKDLDDARDVLAVQGVAQLDMPYVRRWCERHGTLPALDEIVAMIREP